MLSLIDFNAATAFDASEVNMISPHFRRAKAERDGKWFGFWNLRRQNILGSSFPLHAIYTIQPQICLQHITQRSLGILMTSTSGRYDLRLAFSTYHEENIKN
jgi:hypothetical protein